MSKFVDSLFRYIEIVPAGEFYSHIDDADAVIGDVDTDDVLYLASAFARDAAVWSDDSDFAEQELVEVFTTEEILETFKST